MPHVKHKQSTTTTTDRQTDWGNNNNNNEANEAMRLPNTNRLSCHVPRASCLCPERTLLYQNNNKHMPELCLVFCCCNSTFKQLNTHAEIGGTKSEWERGRERGEEASLCLPYKMLSWHLHNFPQ